MRNYRHILITGASSGLGAALAVAYAAEGVRLSLHGRDAARLASVAAGAQKRGAVVSTHTGDVTDEGDMAAWVERCAREQAIDGLIANAGISAGTGAGGESLEQVKKIFAVNVTGVFNSVQPALPLMQARGTGQIGIVSSLAGFRGFPGAPAYCASKAAVRVYGEGLRGEMARYGVGVSVICPGFIKTPMTDVNHFRMPMLMTAEKAAGIIKRGLAENRARIAFPAAMYGAALVMGILPQMVMDWVAARTPKK